LYFLPLTLRAIATFFVGRHLACFCVVLADDLVLRKKLRDFPRSRFRRIGAMDRIFAN
jgi:hypothetical protein